MIDKDTLRAKLKGPPPRSGAGGLSVWIEEHPDAKEFLVLWKGMRDSDETDWDLPRVLKELKTEYGLPFNTCPDNLGRIVRRMFPKTPKD